MNKLLKLFDTYFLKLWVSFLILFIPLYPKLPSVHINNTWVYIRLEDFAIAVAIGLWFLQLLRRKVKIPLPISIPFGLYVASALVSFVLSLIFVGPYIANFFPHVALLSFFR